MSLWAGFHGSSVVLSLTADLPPRGRRLPLFDPESARFSYFPSNVWSPRFAVMKTDSLFAQFLMALPFPPHRWKGSGAVVGR